MLEHVASLRCRDCGEDFRPAHRARCPQCEGGGALRYGYRTDHRARFDRGRWAKREAWLWRYRELLPFDDDLDPPPLHVGATPLYGSPALARHCGVRGLFVKDESRNPTGRIADRAAAVVMAQQGAGPFVCGALAASAAAFAASAGRALIALRTPGEPAAGFGAHTLWLEPALDRDRALLALADDGFALADRPHPLAFEGLKTLGLELGDQLAERLPDWVALDAQVPELVEAVAEGLSQCAALGLFERAPRILAVGGSGGDAQVPGDPAGCEAASRAAQRALGLPIPPSGARVLAGLAQAVREGVVSPDALALAVVQAPTEPPGLAWTPGEALPNYDRLRAAARAAFGR